MTDRYKNRENDSEKDVPSAEISVLCAEAPALIRVGLVEDDEATRRAFAKAIGATDDLVLEMIAASRDEGLRQLKEHELDVLIVDLGLPDGSGLDVIAMSMRIRPTCEVMVFTIYGDETNVLSAIEAGATGYLLKDISTGQMAAEIRSLNAGGSPINPMVARKILMHMNAPRPLAETIGKAPLAPREIDVLKLIARGHTGEETAQKLGLAKSTVLELVRRIYKKLGVSSRAEAADAARRMGLLNNA